MRAPLAIAVSPTGARRTRQDHPNLPITPDEIAMEAARCLGAGACMLHLHVRKLDLSHSLDVEDYSVAIDTIQKTVGKRMVIQITTEAVGKYLPEQQIHVVKSLKPEAASIALREIIQNENDVPMAAEFCAWMYREHVIPQFILYSTEDVNHYFELRVRGVIPGNQHWVLFVLGRYAAGQESKPADLLPFVNLWSDLKTPWAVCAFDQMEAVCATIALALGGHVRVGFENNLFLPDGSRALFNSELVSVVAQIASNLAIPLASADALRDWFG